MAMPMDDDKIDYDEVTLNNTNPLLAEIAADAEREKKEKPRRYWTPKEEERFFEIWGRDNWRLTRTGKNTIFFAQWSDEMKERFDVDVKPEEIQAKVNQTRAKFRQVKKQLRVDKNTTRWKKYDIIAKILKNQYRPKDAEPIPLEALENNRDISSEELNDVGLATSPTSMTSSSTQDCVSTPQTHNSTATDVAHITTALEASAHSDPNMSADGLFNSSDTATRVSYSTELFTDHMDDAEIKREEFQDDYHQPYQYTEPASAYVTPAPEEEPQLHQLQTPQQQLQQQMQQQQYQTQHIQQPAYDHSTNTYINLSTPNATSNRSLLTNNQNHYGNASGSNAHTTVITNAHANQYTNSNYNGNSSSNSLQPPPPPPPPQRRRRGSTLNHTTRTSASAAVAYAADSLEAIYIEEVRKKNVILEEQKDISRKRLQVEERKVTLMEQFFPKCLALQEQILEKLNTT